MAGTQWRQRAGVLRERDFRRFYTGYVTSLLGSAISTVAIARAVLDSGGGATGLGYVFAAGVVSQVVLLPVGAVYGLVSSAVVLTLRPVRDIRWLGTDGRRPDPGRTPQRPGSVLVRRRPQRGEGGQPGGHGDSHRHRQDLVQVLRRRERHHADGHRDPAHGQGERGRDPGGA